jgi:lycopene beta-cyclase
MLQVMHHNGQLMAYIFIQLFQKNSIHDIFRFLDEEASLPDDIRLISTLPKLPFLKALMKVKLVQKV